MLLQEKNRMYDIQIEYYYNGRMKSTHLVNVLDYWYDANIAELKVMYWDESVCEIQKERFQYGTVVSKNARYDVLTIQRTFDNRIDVNYKYEEVDDEDVFQRNKQEE